ncbi:hypothetical protein FNH22_24695 [Fulvivirga sp. M361]|uniref:hypothetical protein n=1 Tax=Fulvivirga sp. M361 TaxID=2594266 RepID=UPI00117B1EB4|nr:hypothetical protein [Fulvivirga sp. M361]TRX51195.1 hypothetical protein FNH22_24695 [Fulvivirga sp. M361]
MLLDFFLVGLAFYLSIPAVVGYFAYSYGRSFWLWFTLGTFLPIVSHIILVVLVTLDERKTAHNELNRREEAEAGRMVKSLLKTLEEERKLTELR